MVQLIPRKKSNIPSGGEVEEKKPAEKKESRIPRPQISGESDWSKIQKLISPSAIKIESNWLQLGKKYLRTIFVVSYPRFLNTNWFTPIINMDKILDIAMYVQPQETGLVLKQLRKKVAEVESQVLDREEKGLVRDPQLETAYRDLEALRDALQQAREKLFGFGVYITIYADDPKELDKIEHEISSIMESRVITVKPATFQQDSGFNTTSPILKDELNVFTRLNTPSIATSFPFVSSDLTSDEGLLYGVNRHNNSLILFDRFTLENSNMVVFGKSGGGKSYAMKLEVLRSLMLGIDVIVIDPEEEYKYLAETVGGSFFKISLNSPHHINPFDLPKPLKGESPADTLRSQIISMVGLLRIMLGGLTPEEDAIIDNALQETYAARDITPTSDFSNITPPLMKDLYAVLENLEGGQNLAVRLKKYTEGSFSGFLNNQSNISTENKLIVFSIRDMEKELRPIAMYTMINYVWNIVRSELKKRILIIDEAWWLMQQEDGASFLFGIAKRSRKYYLGLTTITQEINDFMESKYGKAVVTNSSLQLLLKQSPATIDTAAKTFNLTDEEKFILLEGDVGEGIFFAGLKHASIKVIASYTEDQIITSDPAQILAIEKAKKEFSEEKQK